MRKFLLVMMILSVSLFSANTALLDASKTTGYRISSDTDSYLDISFNVKDINFVEVNTEKGIFSSVSIDNGHLSMNIGSPALPTMHELIAMPYGAIPEVEVISYESKIYKLAELGIEYPIVPAQPSYSKSSKPEDRLFTYNESAYTASKFNDDVIATVSKSGTMRGVGVGVLKVNPFKYNPTEGTIEVYNNLQVRVNYINADPRAEEIKAESYSPYFESSLQTLINYEPSTVKADLMNWPVTYLIVCSDALSGNADLQRLIDWKTEKGFNVLVDYVSASSTIFDNDTWVETQWNTLTPKPSFILLIGDESGTYNVESQDNPALGSTGSVTRSDLEYGVIGATGSSNRIPSMYVGRFSVRALIDFTAQVDKTIWYEKEQFTTSADLTYLTAPLGIAGVDSGFGESHGNPQITYGWMHYFTAANGMNNALYHLYPETTNSAIDAEIIDHIAAGANFYNYTAHGDVTIFADPYFSISDIDGLGNAGEYPLVVGNCCLTNSFGTDECFGEAWLNAPDQGAIGYIGASMSTYWDEDLAMGVGIGDASVQGQEPPDLDTDNPGMYDGAMVLGYASQAATKHVGLMAVEASGSGYTDDYWSSYHLMGDPSVMIYFGIPADPIASHDGVIPPAVTSFTVNTDPYSYVAMGDQDGNLHGAARADASGVANVTVTAYTPGDTAKLVITGQFKKPYFADVLCTGDTGGTFAIDQTNLNYGSVSVGSNSAQQFIISNSHGSEYLMGDITTITGYIVTAAAKTSSQEPIEIIKDPKNVMAYSVAPGTNKTFNLTFEPTSGGNFNGNITITSSDTNHATEYISVTGTGIVPDINLNPTSLSAAALPGNSDVKTFNVENTDLGTLDYSISINYTGGKEIKAAGGPDTYGYKWKDSDEIGGPVYAWEEINGSGTALGLSDDGESASLNLGFTFNYYGVDYTSIVVGSNGTASFTETDIGYDNTSIPTGGETGLLAVFWDDLNPVDGGEVYYYADGANDRFIIEWDGVVDYSSTTPNTFQALIYSSGKIVYQYQDMQGVLNECTVGIGDHTAADGSLVIFNAAYLANNLAIQFQATPEWLSLDSNMGSIIGMGSDLITATCDATDLEIGVYTADIIVGSNDPDESTKILPITFTVTDTPPADPDITLSTATVNTTAAPEANDAGAFDIGNIGDGDLDYNISFVYTSKGKADITVESNYFESGLVYTNGAANNWIVAAGMTGNCAEALVTGANNPVDLILISDVFDGTVCSALTLDFDQIGVKGSSRAPSWKVEYFDGASWLEIYYTLASSSVSQSLSLPVLAANMQVRFTAFICDKNGVDSWNIDNVVISGPEDASPIAWLSIDSPISGTVIPAGSNMIDISCDAAGLAEAIYTADITIVSNDPDEPSVVLPVVFTVSGGTIVPAVPANIVTSISGSDLVIDWDVSADATGYDVYSSDDPYGTFTLATSVGTNQYTVATDQAKLFYYIVATNATK